MNSNVKKMVVSAMLAAIAIAIPMFMPPFLKINLPPFTATLASHVPLIIAMFISPWSAVFVTIISAIGFLFAFPDPSVAFRAAMHIFFVLAGAMMIRKDAKIYWVILVTFVLHTASDMIAVLIYAAAFNPAILKGTVMSYAQYIIAVGTSIHHLIDFAISYFICRALYNAGLIKYHVGKKMAD